MALSVARPATSSLQARSGISVTAYYEDQLATTDVVLVPLTYELSGDPARQLGEQAEEKVVHRLQEAAADIPGLQLIVFHGLRVVGRKPALLRECDSLTLATYNQQHYIFAQEVKCNQDPQTSNNTRKKAITQLNALFSILSAELGIPTGRIQRSVAWTRMAPTEACGACGGSHPPLYEKPPECRQPGTSPRSDPEPPGFHLFEDTFTRAGFTAWLHTKVTDGQLAVDPDTYRKVLEYATQQCVGVLLDQTVGTFCILSPEQHRLVTRLNDSLSLALFVLGLGGTGKTVCVGARIQFIYLAGWLGPHSKVMFVYFHQNVQSMMLARLTAASVDLSHVDFVDYSNNRFNLGDLLIDENVLEDLKRAGYKYIYVDSCEDLGVSKVQQMLEKSLELDSLASQALGAAGSIQLQPLLAPAPSDGDFWLLIDPFQGLQDPHNLERDFRDRVRWRGSQLDRRLVERGEQMGRVVTLTQSFRMPETHIEHIKAKHVLPIKNYPQAPGVKGFGVLREVLHLDPSGFSQQWLAAQLADKLYHLVFLRGVHPGQRQSECTAFSENAFSAQMRKFNFLHRLS